MQPSYRFPQPVDRLAAICMIVLSFVIGAAVALGERTPPRVVEMSWADRLIGAEEQAFVMTFSRPMDRDSVEANLRIEPPLPGKISWSGRRLAYTLGTPAPYGTAYEVRLEGARDRFGSDESKQGKPKVAGNGDAKAMQPYVAHFRTRDRAFAYIGIAGEQKGRLVLVNLTQSDTKVLTPPDLTVVDFKPYPGGDRILFSATDAAVTDARNPQNLKIFTVTTGIRTDVDADQAEPTPGGKLDLVLDNQEYQNLKFDLSADGKTIVAQRASLRNPGGDFGIWVLRESKDPQRLDMPPGGDFLIAPDSSSLAIAQGQGIAIVPLTTSEKSEEPLEPLSFFPQFSQVLGFSADGSKAAMVKYNSDYTRSLYLVTTQGEETEVLRTPGSILKAIFDPSGQLLYCLLTELLEGEEYIEQPYIASYNLKGDRWLRLWDLPPQLDLQLSLAPDGLSLLFDRLEVLDPSQVADKDASLTKDGLPIENATLWVLPTIPPTAKGEDPTPLEPEALPIQGIHPLWLP